MPKPSPWKDGIRKEPNGSWTAKYKQHWSRGHQSKQDAQKARLRLITAGKQPESVTVREWAETWTTDPAYVRPAESTRRWYAERMKRLVAELGSKPLTEVTRADARAFCAKFPNCRKPANALFSDAVRDGVGGLTQSPFEGLKMPKQPGRSGDRIEVLTGQQVDRLVDLSAEIHGDYGLNVFGPMVRFAANTGLRPGELYALEWPDVLWRERVVWVRRQYRSGTGELVEYTKNRRERRIALLPGARDALLRVPPLKEQGGPVFYTARGHTFALHNLSYYWRPVREAFGRPDMDFYELRHYFGTMLARAGVSPYDIAAQLGHRDGGRLAMLTYVHTPQEESNDRVQRALGGLSEGLTEETG